MRTRVGPLVAVLALTLVAGCGAGGTAGSQSASSCAAVLVHDGHRYLGVAPVRRDPATTGRLARAVLAACDDTGGRERGRDENVRVAELVGVPLATAVLLDGEVYVRDGRALPQRSRRWFRAPRCAGAGEIRLAGDWLGVTGRRRPRFDGDVRPPYRVRMHVTDGPRRYVGATLEVHASGSTDPGLAPRDVRTSLWRGGRLEARVRCAGGRYEAAALRVP